MLVLMDLSVASKLRVGIEVSFYESECGVKTLGLELKLVFMNLSVASKLRVEIEVSFDESECGIKTSN